jgi:hypothetical protein
VPYPSEGSAKLKSVAEKPKELTKEEWSAIALKALADNKVVQAVRKGATAYRPEQYNESREDRYARQNPWPAAGYGNDPFANAANPAEQPRLVKSNVAPSMQQGYVRDLWSDPHAGLFTKPYKTLVSGPPSQSPGPGLDMSLEAFLERERSRTDRAVLTSLSRGRR